MAGSGWALRARASASGIPAAKRQNANLIAEAWLIIDSRVSLNYRARWSLGTGAQPAEELTTLGPAAGPEHGFALFDVTAVREVAS